MLERPDASCHLLFLKEIAAAQCKKLRSSRRGQGGKRVQNENRHDTVQAFWISWLPFLLRFAGNEPLYAGIVRQITPKLLRDRMKLFRNLYRSKLPTSAALRPLE